MTLRFNWLIIAMAITGYITIWAMPEYTIMQRFWATVLWTMAVALLLVKKK